MKTDPEVDNRDLVTTELHLPTITLEVNPFDLFMNALENRDETLAQDIIKILGMWLNPHAEKVVRTMQREDNVQEVYKELQKAYEGNK